LRLVGRLPEPLDVLGHSLVEIDWFLLSRHANKGTPEIVLW
jgi:hypothetical protein